MRTVCNPTSPGRYTHSEHWAVPLIYPLTDQESVASVAISSSAFKLPPGWNLRVGPAYKFLVPQLGLGRFMIRE